MNKLSLTILCVLFLPIAQQKNYEKVKLLRVYDGDTIVVDLPCSYDLFCKAIPVRIKGIDTPEIRGKCPQEKVQALAARDFLQSFLQQKPLSLTDCERGKYFRIICNVYAEQTDIASLLINKGLAHHYNGQAKRIDWCK